MFTMPSTRDPDYFFLKSGMSGERLSLDVEFDLLQWFHPMGVETMWMSPP